MKITVSLVQMEVKQGDVSANLAKGERFIQEAALRGSTLIVFPEMWTTGFDYEKNKALSATQQLTLEKLASFAKQYHIWISGSLLTHDEGKKPKNTAVLLNPEGVMVATYSKTHLFSLIQENKNMSPGDSLVVTDTSWGKTGFAICYDMRFPEVCRTLALHGAELIISPIAIPHPRLAQWQVLVRARAIENQLFVLSANHVGSEIWPTQGEVSYFGHSCIIDPQGETLIEANHANETLLTAEIEMEKVKETRGQIRVFEDRKPDLYF